MKQKNILVTGGNKGIGLEICRQLARQGHRVILTARDDRRRKAAEDELAGEGLRVDSAHLDVDRVDSFDRFAGDLEKKIGRLDVLINNAGILLKDRDSYDAISLNDWEAVLRTNVTGPFFLTRTLLPLLKLSEDPRVVNVSSLMGSLTEMGSGRPAYRISKTALNGFTRFLAAEAPWLSVNSLHPGHVQTDMGGSYAPRSVEKGADTAVWLATTPDPGSGAFYFDRKKIQW